MSIAFFKGKPIFVNGRIGIGKDCCCDDDGECHKACFWVSAGRSGTDVSDEPNGSPPTTVQFTAGEAQIIYHGHARDCETGTLGYYYHSHLWMLEFCWRSLANTTSGRNATDYVAKLQNWAQNELDWGEEHPVSANAGEFECQNAIQINNLKSIWLQCPPGVCCTTEDLPLPPHDENGCPPECVDATAT